MIFLESHTAERASLLTEIGTRNPVCGAVRENRLSHQEAGRFLKFYEEALYGYTYLEEPGD
jgi:arginine decarboxylase-like protein